MSWHKLGRVFAPDGALWWARSYASFPTADVHPDGRIRIYYTSLDERQDGRVGYVDVAADNPLALLGTGTEPVLDIGGVGEFDDCGANAFSVVTVGSEKYLYYQGWQRTTKAPAIFSGLAIGPEDGRSFRKVGRVPILDRTEEEPYLRGAPFVLRDGDSFRMWYVSCTHWAARNDKPVYHLIIRTALSADGVHWNVDPRTCLEPIGDEYAVGRPCVVRDSDRYQMWYSIRSFVQPYRIGYAESSDGVVWSRRNDQAGLERSAAGWDAEMICYAHVVDSFGKRYLFFNGNQHGSTGFGVAEWRDDSQREVR